MDLLLLTGAQAVGAPRVPIGGSNADLVGSPANLLSIAPDKMLLVPIGGYLDTLYLTLLKVKQFLANQQAKQHTT